MAIYIIVGVIAYLIGSISFGVIFTKKMAGFDVREKGSKGAGATNVLRNAGKKIAALTLICDILKGIVAVLIAVLLGNIIKDIDASLLVQISGIAVVIGHTFPIFFGFKGGKGVATSLGILLLIMALTRMVSVGSVLAAILFPVLTLFIGQNYIVPGNYFVFSIIMALIVAFNHRTNISRILNGTENKLSLKK